MSKITTDFMKKLAEQQENNTIAPKEKAPEIKSETDLNKPAAVEEDRRSQETQNREDDIPKAASIPENEDVAAPKAKTSRSQMGRPSSFPEGVRKERVMVTMTEVDKEALRLYQETTSGARDRSEIVRAAMAAYIPENIYSMAEMMVKMKHKA